MQVKRLSSTDAEKVFDADASTNQEYTVTFKPIVKDIQQIQLLRL